MAAKPAQANQLVMVQGGGGGEVGEEGLGRMAGRRARAGAGLVSRRYSAGQGAWNLGIEQGAEKALLVPPA